MPIEQIRRFAGPHRFLSNFVSAVVMYDGRIYRSVEHAFQAAKTLDQQQREHVGVAGSAAEAKRRGRRVTLRPDWDTVKIAVMTDLVRQKFTLTVYRRQLLQTGEAELVEGNEWGDTFWGVCRGEGENHLGQILMRVRDEIRGRS